ncbi:reverse transcriptase domain-containing protein [Tanacetum coccineum]
MMNERYSAVLLNKLPSKEKDIGTFIIPCDIGHLHIDNALADLISLMPCTMYEKLGLGEPKPTRMSLELADRSIQYPRGIAENVLIKIDKFILPIDFVILDMREDSRILTILGRPFLATARAMIDVFNKKITLRVGNEEVLEKRKGAIAWKMSNIKGISPSFCTHKILMEESFKPVIHPQRRLNPKVKDVVKNEIVRSMSFGLCNATATFQRCMTTIFHDMVEEFMEVFMDDFSVFGNSFDQCLDNLDKMLARCEETNLVLNWEKCHFMVKEDHLSRLENPNMGELTKEEIADKFPDEHLMILKAKLNDDEPWNYFWDEPYALRLCPDNVMRRCVAGDEILEILAHCHSGPTGGHHSASITGRKVYESGFYWPNIFKDAKDYVTKCDACQKSGNISSRSEMPQNNIYTPTGCTPFRLVYGKACHLPIEIEHKAYWALKQCNMDLTVAAKNRFMELNELTELRDGAYENTWIYKERTMKWHDSRLRGDKDFKIRDKVLLFNSLLRLHLGKLKSKWSSPLVVKTVYLYGAMEITDKNGSSFKVNGQKLKRYYDGSINTEDNEFVELNE